MQYKPSPLTLEQQFGFASFKSQVDNMDRSQAQNMAIMLYEQMMLRENGYKELLKKQWFGEQ